MFDPARIEIEKKPVFFDWYWGSFICKYHIEKTREFLRIYASYNILRDTKFLYLFELAGNSNGYRLIFFNNKHTYTMPVGNKKEEVVKIVVEKIIRGTTLGPRWAEIELALVGENQQKKEECEERIRTHMKQKEKLIQILREIFNEYIS